MMKYLSFFILFACSVSFAFAEDPKKQYPPDIEKFISQRDLCDHLSGEPRESLQGTPEFNEWVVDTNKACAGVERKQRTLKKKYLGIEKISRVLQQDDSQIETK